MHTHLIILAWLAPVINALQTPPRKKVVVVGAGWAGLSTAWTLSKNNVDVTLVDAAARPGGVVRDGFKTRGGRPAEAGQHGFWEEYFNIYKLLYDELKLEEDPLTGYAEQGQYSPAGLEAIWYRRQRPQKPCRVDADVTPSPRRFVNTGPSIATSRTSPRVLPRQGTRASSSSRP